MARRIQDVRRRASDPQRTYSWEVAILGPATGGLPDLTLYARNVSIPSTSVEQFSIPFKAGNVYFSGRDSSGHTVNLTFWDDEAQTIRNYFENWINTQMLNQTSGGHAPKPAAVAEVVITLFDTEGQTPTGRIRLTNAFPTEIGDISLDYNNSEALEISITMSWDEKIIEQV